MRLILMRHSRTEGAHPLGDHARELTPDGRSDAASAGDQLAAYDVDYALVSTAARTRQTFEHLDLDVTCEYLDTIYDQDHDEIVQRIAGMPDDVATLLVIGHAPSMPSLAMDLAVLAGATAEAEDLARWFPTSAYAVFEVSGHWGQLAGEGFDSVRLERLER